MKVHFLSLVWGQIVEELDEQYQIFREENLALKLLCDWSDVMEEKGLSGPAPLTAGELETEINFALEVAEGEPGTEEILQLLQVGREILQMLASLNISYPGQTDLQTQSIRRFIKMLRQEYWLSWMEDLFFGKVEQAFQLSVASLPDHDSEQRLFVVVFPEACFQYKEYCVYRETAYRFIHGLLRRDISRTGARMKSLVQLSAKLDDVNRKVILFGGTITWKEQGIYYALAPVFFTGRCWLLWEKQTISSEDGKCFIDKHRHCVAFGSDAKEYAGKGFQAGSLTKEFLNADTSTLGPVFDILIFNVRIKFAISICLDFSCPEILGNVDADIHVLMARGMPPWNNLKNIRSKSIFLYCDMTCSNTAMFKLGDSKLWNWKDRIFCKWENINTDEMENRCYRDVKIFLVKGIYIAENVEDL